MSPSLTKINNCSDPKFSWKFWAVVIVFTLMFSGRATAQMHISENTVLYIKENTILYSEDGIIQNQKVQVPAETKIYVIKNTKIINFPSDSLVKVVYIESTNSSKRQLTSNSKRNKINLAAIPSKNKGTETVKKCIALSFTSNQRETSTLMCLGKQMVVALIFSGNPVIKSLLLKNRINGIPELFLNDGNPKIRILYAGLKPMQHIGDDYISRPPPLK